VLGPQDFRSGAAAPARAISDPVGAAQALRAAGSLKQALAVTSDAEFSVELYNLRGDLQLELGQIDEAARSYAAVIAAEPGNLHAHDRLAQCMHRQNRWDAAAASLRRLLTYDPDRDQARLRLGECLLHLNRLDDAMDCFEECQSATVRMPALFGKAVVLQLQRRFEEAEATYECVLEIDPAAEEALANLVAMSLEVFDLQRVEYYAARLLELNPPSTIALQGLALVAIERGEYDAAARYFARLVERGSGGEVEASDAIEYRLSREVVERLNAIRSAGFASA
jgi:tetratricopeptide (TPR) repeat protein